MAQELLDSPEVRPAIQHVRGARVTQRVRMQVPSARPEYPAPVDHIPHPADRCEPLSARREGASALGSWLRVFVLASCDLTSRYRDSASMHFLPSGTERSLFPLPITRAARAPRSTSPERQPRELAHAQTGPVEELEDGAAAATYGAVVGAFHDPLPSRRPESSVGSGRLTFGEASCSAGVRCARKRRRFIQRMRLLTVAMCRATEAGACVRDSCASQPRSA